MSTAQINQIAGAGMDNERARLELATIKLSLMNISFSSNVEAVDFLAQIRTGGGPYMDEKIHDSSSQVKRVVDTDNPLADADGYVYKLAIDPTREMATLISATRAYEANVRAYNANSQMNKAALDIGNR